MTEKDAVKCFHFAKKNWWYLPVNIQISLSNKKKIISKIEKIIKKKNNNLTH